jgi:MoaA/NifB/PqqE/SkfB family radical SAM enzyme
MARLKAVQSRNYNFIFDKVTGEFCRWGKTKDDDPQYSPFGPELLDIEVSTVCNGTGTPCAFCYKANGPRGKNMSLDTFKTVLSKFDLNILTQIAFGIGDIDANPDLFAMFRHCRENGIIPNVTINGYGMTAELTDALVTLCGAVAVSCYEKDLCYNTVEMLGKAGL